MTAEPARTARADWQERIGRRSDAAAWAAPAALPAPAEFTAEPGAALVMLRWAAVAGAAGYVLSRADQPDGEYWPLDHGGSDVVAVPAPPYADTTGQPGRTYWYTVAATAGVDLPAGEATAPVAAAPLSQPPAPLGADVDAAAVVGRLDRVWWLVGAERLSQLDAGRDPFGNDIGAEFGEALAISRAELGATMVRAHAIYHDDLAVCRFDGRRLTVDFTRVDRVYDKLLTLGLRPVVELSFMPRELARDPAATVFDYRAIVSPPRDWDAWAELNGRLAEHLVARYGIEEVAQWAFEVWNEPNLEVFWTGSREEYLRLYDTAARAIKAVDPRLRVGGPATAAAGWIEDFADYLASTDAPADFLSTHTYGNVPLDLRPIPARHGVPPVPVWWTEWGVGSTHFGPIHDTAFGAPFVLRGMKAVQGRLDALAYWVVSDHFEELGRPDRLFHNGFGLLTVGNLRKPRFWAQRMGAELGDHVLATDLRGDGAGGLVDVWAARDDRGGVDVLLWNGTPNASQFHGAPALSRVVRLRITGLGPDPRAAWMARVDEHHSNIATGWPPEHRWPDAAQWQHLRRIDQLAEWRLDDIPAGAGSAEFEIDLPMPAVARIRLSAGRRPPGTTDEGTAP